LFLLSRFFSWVFGSDRVLSTFEKLRWYGAAWELLAFYSLQKLKQDVTQAYTFEFAVLEIRKAQFAFLAQKYEFAWVNADDAIAILQWKGEKNDSLYLLAMDLRVRSEVQIEPWRVLDLRKNQQIAHVGFFNRDSLEFNREYLSSDGWIARVAWRGIGRPRINDRLP